MRARGMVMAFLPREMEIILKAIGLMIIVKVKDHISIVIKINYSLVSGLMTNQKPVYIRKSKMMKLKLDQKGHISKTHTYFHQFQN